MNEEKCKKNNKKDKRGFNEILKQKTTDGRFFCMKSKKKKIKEKIIEAKQVAFSFVVSLHLHHRCLEFLFSKRELKNPPANESHKK